MEIDDRPHRRERVPSALTDLFGIFGSAVVLLELIRGGSVDCADESRGGEGVGECVGRVDGLEEIAAGRGETAELGKIKQSRDGGYAERMETDVASYPA